MKIIYIIFRLAIVLVFALQHFSDDEARRSWDFLHLQKGQEFYLNVIGYYFLTTLVIDLLELLVAFVYRRRKRMLWYKYDNFILGISQICFILNVIVPYVYLDRRCGLVYPFQGLYLQPHQRYGAYLLQPVVD